MAELSQDEIDKFVQYALPNYDTAQQCKKCGCPTKRILFTGGQTMRVKIVDSYQNRLMNGKIMPNTMFCFACGTFSFIDQV